MFNKTEVYYLLRNIILAFFALFIIFENAFILLNLVYQFPIPVEASEMYYMLYLVVIAVIVVAYMAHTKLCHVTTVILISTFFITTLLINGYSAIINIINLNQYSQLIDFTISNYMVIVIGILMTSTESINLLLFTKSNEKLE